MTIIASPLAVVTNPHRVDWRILDDREFDTPQQGMARDAELGVEVANGGPPTFRLWSNPQSLAISHQDTRLPGFADAVEVMTATGWPLVVRETGGSAVPLGQGVLNLSLVIPRSLLADYPGTSLEMIYGLLCKPIRQTLSTLNINSVFGSVPGAFCDGRFNLVAKGRKLVGTAQVWRGNRAEQTANGDGYVLAQAALLVDVDAQAVTDVVSRFYRLAGRPTQFGSTDIISVRELIGTHDRLGIPEPGLVDRIREMILDRCQRIQE
ncbi:MAG: lipoate--protein ligase family protein [Acidiferrobacterales bacterium]